MNPTPYQRGALNTLDAIRAMRAPLPDAVSGFVCDLTVPPGSDRGRVRVTMVVTPRRRAVAGLRAMLDTMDEAPTLLVGISPSGATLRWDAPDGFYAMTVSAAELRAAGLLDVAA